MPRPKGLPKTGGRQKGAKNKATIEREVRQARAREAYLRRIAPKVEALADKQWALAQAEDGRLAQLVIADMLDRLTGRAPQAIELTGKDGGPIKTERVEFVDAPSQ